MVHAVVGLTLSLILVPAQADGLDLRWKLAKGDTFYTRTVTDLNQTIDVAGMMMEQMQKQTVVHRYKVLDAGSKGTLIEQTVLKADIEGNLPMGGEIAERMKGAVLTFSLDDKFLVTKVGGYDKYLEKIAGEDEMTRNLLRTFITEENLKIGIQDLFSFLPDKPVRPGDTWKRSNKMTLGPLGNFSLSSQFKLKDLEKGLARIESVSEAKYEAPKEGGDAGGFAITKGELKGEKLTGTIVFDPKSGRVKESRTDVQMKGTLTVSVGGMETEVGISQRLTMTGTVSDKNLGDD
jgi:hypothetical protein